MSAVRSLASAHRIKRSHRRRRQVASAHRFYILNNPLAGTDPTGYAANLKSACDRPSTRGDCATSAQDVQPQGGTRQTNRGNGQQARATTKSTTVRGPTEIGTASASSSAPGCDSGGSIFCFITQDNGQGPTFLEETKERLFPHGDMFRVTGEAFGALTAFGVGVATGDQAFQNTAVEGMRENVTSGDGVNAAMMLVSPRGAPGRSGTATVRAGGAGPVRVGQSGVAETVAEIRQAGGTILGEEITIVANNGVRTRPDLFVQLPCGTRCFVEVKTGPTATLTRNQASAFPSIRSSGGVPVGANAAAAGLTPGVPIGPTPVWTVHRAVASPGIF